MPALPPQDNRALQAVDALKKDIQSGKLDQTLPGERELAQRLRISRKTLRKAIRLLEEELWISPAQQGRRRQILFQPNPQTDKKASSKALKGKSVVTMAPLPLDQMGGSERVFQSRLNSLCSRLDITLMHRSLDIRHLKRPSFRLREFIKQNPADLYLLQHSSLPIQQWFKENSIPCIVLGSAWADIKLPSVDVDPAAIGVHTAALIQRSNHQHIAFIHPTPEKRGLQLLIESLHQQLPGAVVHTAGHQDTPESIARAVTLLLSRQPHRPTILLCPTANSIITAFTTATGLGLNIPADLSLLCLSYDQSLKFFNPSIPGYQVNLDDYPKAVLKVLLNCLRHPHSTQQHLITPNFIQGGSLSKIKRTTSD